MVNGIFNFHDMSTKPQILTGHTDIVRQYLTDEERAKLAPGQLAPEQRTEDGKVLHTVEVLADYERFGRVSTECFTVQIPECPELERVKLGTQVRFDDDFAVVLRTRREGGSSVVFQASGMRIVGNAIPAKPGE